MANSIQKIWLTAAVAIFAFAFAAFGKIQGGPTPTGPLSMQLYGVSVLLFDPKTPDAIVAMMAVVIVAVAMVFLARLISFHTDLAGATAYSRYPFRAFEVEPDSPAGHLLFWVAFFLLTVLPYYTMFHFWHVFVAEGRLCEPVADSSAWRNVIDPSLNVLSLPPDWTISHILFDGYRLGGEEGCWLVAPRKSLLDMVFGSATEVRSGNPGLVSYFPVVQPIVMFLITLWSCWETLRGLRKVFWG